MFAKLLLADETKLVIVLVNRLAAVLTPSLAAETNFGQFSVTTKMYLPVLVNARLSVELFYWSDSTAFSALFPLFVAQVCTST